MRNITLSEFCRIIGVENALPDMVINQFCIRKTRISERNSVYFAYTSEGYDGYNFDYDKIRDLDCVIVTEKQIEDLPCIIVPNIFKAMRTFAKHCRDDFEDLKTIIVTGSIGKTSTKTMIFSVLEENAKTISNAGSVNSTNEACRLTYELDNEHKYLLMELGLRAPGRPFSNASKILSPNIGVITNIGHSHIENFKNKAHILEHKLSMTDYMKEDGILFLNGDDKLLYNSKYKFKTIFFAIKNKKADYFAQNIKIKNNSITFNVVSKDGKINYPLKLNVTGEHNILNAIAAFAIGISLNIPLEQIAQGIANFKTTGYRQNVKHGYKNNIVIADCYNATPESMISGFEMLKNINSKGRKIAVLGHMMRLGKRSEKLHRKTGKDVSKYKFDLVLTYGLDARYIYEEVKKRRGRCAHFYTKEDLLNYLRGYVKEEDTILFKGVAKFHDFQDLYYGFMKSDIAYCGEHFNDKAMHTEASAMYFGDSENYYVGKNIHKQIKIKDLAIVFAVYAILKQAELTDKITISANAAKKHIKGTEIKFNKDNIFSAENLLQAALLKSSFESVYALGEHYFEDFSGLIKEINKIIKRLELKNTKIENISLKEDKNTYTSAYDMYKFISYALKDEKFRSLIQTKITTLNNQKSGKQTRIRTDNKLLYPEKRVQYIDYSSKKAIGIKSENIYSDNNEITNHNLVSCIKTDNDFVIGVILGSNEFYYCNNTYIDMKRILEKIAKIKERQYMRRLKNLIKSIFKKINIVK